MEAENKVFLGEDQILEIVITGSQTRASLKETTRTARRLIAALRREQKPVNILVDLTKVDKITVDGRRAAAEELRNVDFDLVALYGAGVFKNRVATLIITAVGQAQHIHIFNTRNEAAGWIKGNKKIVPQPVFKIRTSADLENYVTHVQKQLKLLEDAIAMGVIGEYSGEISIPDDGDEFLDVFVGIRILLQTLEEKQARLYELESKLKLENKKRPKRVSSPL